MVLLSDPALTREAYSLAADAFVQTLHDVDAADADLAGVVPGAAWTLGELIAHTMRAFTCIEQYLDGPTERSNPTPIVDAVEYYQVALSAGSVHEGIVARARQAARDLHDPFGQAEVTAQRIGALVASTADDDPVYSPGGCLVMSEYLVTRTVELALHTVDIQRAIGQPAEIHPTISRLIIPVLSALGPSTQIVLALTGRGTLADGFNVLS